MLVLQIRKRKPTIIDLSNSNTEGELEPGMSDFRTLTLLTLIDSSFEKQTSKTITTTKKLLSKVF